MTPRPDAHEDPVYRDLSSVRVPWARLRRAVPTLVFVVLANVAMIVRHLALQPLFDPRLGGTTFAENVSLALVVLIGCMVLLVAAIFLHVRGLIHDRTPGRDGIVHSGVALLLVVVSVGLAAYGLIPA